MPNTGQRRGAVRTTIGMGLVVFLMAIVEVLALKKGGTLGIVLIGALAGIALILLAVGFNLAKLAMGVTYLAAFTLTWNGWFVGPVRPGDVLVLFALLLFILSYDGASVPRLPVWVVQVAFVVAFVAAFHAFFQESAQYLSSRIVLSGKGTITQSTKGSVLVANLAIAFKFIVAIAAIPFMFIWAESRKPGSYLLFAKFFAVGAALSGWVALLERVGIPNIDLILTGKSGPGLPRQIGLSNHPNFLAAGLTLALPVALWLMVAGETKLWRWLGALSVIGCFGGMFASGSRGGTVCLAGAFIISMILIPKLRRFVAPVLLSGAVVTGVLVLYFPSIGTSLLKATRLIGSSSTTSGSDLARSIVGHQAWIDINHSPIIGIGLQVSAEAQNVYLQELASGGVILFAGMLIYELGALVTALRLLKVDDGLGAALACSIAGTLALNIFEADLTDRFYYVPVGLICAMAVAQRRHASEHDPDHEDNADATRAAIIAGHT